MCSCQRLSPDADVIHLTTVYVGIVGTNARALYCEKFLSSLVSCGFNPKEADGTVEIHRGVEQTVHILINNFI